VSSVQRYCFFPNVQIFWVCVFIHVIYDAVHQTIIMVKKRQSSAAIVVRDTSLCSPDERFFRFTVPREISSLPAIIRYFTPRLSAYSNCLRSLTASG